MISLLKLPVLFFTTPGYLFVSVLGIEIHWPGVKRCHFSGGARQMKSMWMEYAWMPDHCCML